MAEWKIDIDEEFGGDLLRWNDNVIAQVTGEEQDGCNEAYGALVKLVRFKSSDEAAYQHVAEMCNEQIDDIRSLEARVATLEASLAEIIDVWFSDAEWVRPEYDGLLYAAHRLLGRVGATEGERA